MCETRLTSLESESSYKVLASLNLISAILTVGSNLLVLCAVYSNSPLRRISNFFVASLAFADLLVGLIMDPVYALIFLFRLTRNSNHPLRITEHWIWLQTVITTTFTLTAVSIDRYIAVTNCFRYVELVTFKRCSIGLTGIWIFSITYASVRLFISEDTNLPALWVCTTILTVFIPLLIILYCYMRIFKEARSQNVRIAASTNMNTEQCTEVLKNKKAAWTVSIVIGLFVVLWAPSLALSFWGISTTDSCKQQFITCLWFWAAFLSFTSSLLNPWVYAIRTREFRRAFLKVLGISK